MIEIIAKDYDHFYEILRQYGIAEHKAIFVPWKMVSLSDSVNDLLCEAETSAVAGDKHCDYWGLCS